MKDQKTLSDFLTVVKGAKNALNNVEKAMKEKLGEGIRRYKQSRRKAYKIDNDNMEDS